MTNKSLGHKSILAIAGLGLVLIFVSSFVYRVNNPSLTIKRQTERQSEAAPMEMIGQLMRKLEQNPQDVSTLRSLGRAFMSMQSWQRAASFWQRLLEVEPKNKEAAHQLAMCYFRMEDFNKSAARLEKIINFDPKSYHAHYNLGILYKHYLNDMQKARKHLKIVINAEEAKEDLRQEAQKELQE
jgi:tetratricopeptide (TPR) repeat protein